MSYDENRISDQIDGGNAYREHLERLATEYQSPEVQRLIEIGRSTEMAFENYHADITIYENDANENICVEVNCIQSISDLLEWQGVQHGTD